MGFSRLLTLLSLSAAAAPGSVAAGEADCTPWCFVPRDAYTPAACDVEIDIQFHLFGPVAELPTRILEAQVDALNSDFLAAETGLGFVFDPDSDTFRYRESRAPDDLPQRVTTRGPRRVLVWVGQLEDAQAETVDFAASSDGPKDATRWIWLDAGSLGPRGVSVQPGNLGRTLTHEMGHALGLLHPFEEGCTDARKPECYFSGDTLCDTPPQSGPSPGGSCGPMISCGAQITPSNFMDVSDDGCRTTFTREQVQRMRCVLRYHWTESPPDAWRLGGAAGSAPASADGDP